MSVLIGTPFCMFRISSKIPTSTTKSSQRRKPGARDRYGSPSDRQSGPPHERPAGPPHGFEILPGESLAKYTRGTSDVAGPATSADSSVGPPEPGAPPEQAQFAPEGASEERRGGT